MQYKTISKYETILRTVKTKCLKYDLLYYIANAELF